MLEFVHDDVTYKLLADGSLSGTSAAGNLTGTWSASSTSQSNELTLSPNGMATVTVPVKYDLFSGLHNGRTYRNALRIEVASAGGNVFALLGGKIVIDNAQDIEFHLPEDGAKFILYGSLAFEEGYKKLTINLNGGGKAVMKVIIQLSGNPDNATGERDILKADVLTVWPNLVTGATESLDGIIELSGKFEPQNGEIVFLGSIDGTQTFDVTIAAKSFKVFQGGLRLYSEEGQTGLELDLRSQFNFNGRDGTFGVALGYSATEGLEAEVQFAFGDLETDEEGRTGLKATSTFNLIGQNDGNLDVEFDLEGRFEVGEHSRLVTFKLDADYSNNALSLDFSGTVEVDASKQLTYKINYDDGDVQVGLKFEDTERDFWIQILAGSSNFEASFVVRFTFPPGGGPLEAGEAEQLTADGVSTGV